MSMTRQAHSLWRTRVLVWREKYPDPRWVKGKYEPRRIRATPLRCRKCGTTDHVTRHHKGHEYLFACIMPEWYAGRYIRFVNADWVPLCSDRCHTAIHELYAPIVDEIKLYIRECIKEVRYAKDDVDCEYPIYTWAHRPDRRVLESFRKRLVSRCDSWLARKNKKYRRGKYRDQR